jgi:hypothetical protein
LSTWLTDAVRLATYCGASLPLSSPSRDRDCMSRGRRSAVPEPRFALPASRALRTRQNIRRHTGPRQIRSGPVPASGRDLDGALRPASRGPCRSDEVPTQASPQTRARKKVFDRRQGAGRSGLQGCQRGSAAAQTRSKIGSKSSGNLSPLGARRSAAGPAPARMWRGSPAESQIIDADCPWVPPGRAPTRRPDGHRADPEAVPRSDCSQTETTPARPVIRSPRRPAATPWATTRAEWIAPPAAAATP